MGEGEAGAGRECPGCCGKGGRNRGLRRRLPPAGGAAAVADGTQGWMSRVGRESQGGCYCRCCRRGCSSAAGGEVFASFLSIVR